MFLSINLLVEWIFSGGTTKISYFLFTILIQKWIWNDIRGKNEISVIYVKTMFSLVFSQTSVLIDSVEYRTSNEEKSVSNAEFLNQV